MTNEEVLRIATEKRTFVDAIRERRWKTSGCGPKHPEELHNIIIEGRKENCKALNS